MINSFGTATNIFNLSHDFSVGINLKFESFHRGLIKLGILVQPVVLPHSNTMFLAFNLWEKSYPQYIANCENWT